MTMKTIPFSEARAHLPETLQKVQESRDPLLISRRGKAGAVLVSVETWDSLASSPVAGFAEGLTDWRAHYAVEAVPAAEDEFDNLRDDTPGRGFSW